jgi:hypothetical protein
MVRWCFGLPQIGLFGLIGSMLGFGIMNLASRLRRLALLAVLVAWCCSPWSAGAIPLTLRYQGHIQVDGAAFDGTGQFKFMLLAAGQSVWSHDGTGSAVSAPDSHLAVTVARGVYSIGLGDTTIAGMAAIPPTVFTNDALGLRVWFNDGVNGFEQLAPDQAVGPVAFAVRAQTAATSNW